MEINVIQINGGITINNNLSVKKIMYVKKIIFGMLLVVIVEMENIKQVLWMQLPMMKLQSHKKKKQKLQLY